MPTLLALAKKLYEDRKETGDVVFIVNTERIHAHKCILAALSPKYKTQFYGSQPDVGEIPVKDISAAAFKVFIRFFYGKSTNLTFENITEILNLAKLCLVDRFVNKCGTFLKDSINANNVCWVYRLAMLYDLKWVRAKCEGVIRSNVPRLFKNPDFLRCEQIVLVEILKIEPLNCEETDILKGCIHWAHVACQRALLNASDPMSLRHVLGPAVEQIRFNSLTLNQFAKFNATYKKFFTLEEFQEITNIIAELKDFKSKRFNQRSRKRHASTDSSFSESTDASTTEDSDYSQ